MGFKLKLSRKEEEEINVLSKIAFQCPLQCPKFNGFIKTQK